MSSTKFQYYQHGKPRYANRKAKEEWENHRAMLTVLHDQGISRKLMREALEDTGFEVTTGQLTKKMMEWGLKPRATDRSNSSTTASTKGSSVANASRLSLEQHDLMNQREQQFAPPKATSFPDEYFQPVNLDAQERYPGNMAPPSEYAPFDRLSRSPSTNPASGDSLNSSFWSAPNQRNGGSGMSVRTLSTSGTSWPGTSLLSKLATNLRSTEKHSLFLKKLKTIDITNGNLPLSTCRCEHFFTRKGQFVAWSALYRMLFDSTSDTDSVRHAIGLIRMKEDQAQTGTLDDMLENTIDSCMKLLWRPYIRNDVAFPIALHLARRYDFRNNEAQYESELSKTAMVHQCDERYHSTRLAPLLTLTKADLPDISHAYAPEPFTHRLYRSHTDEMARVPMLLQDCRTILADSKGQVLRFVLERLKCAVCRKCPCRCKEALQTELEGHKLLEIAADISSFLTSNVQTIHWRINGTITPLEGSIMMDAVGLMVARVFGQARYRYGLRNSINDEYTVCLDTALRGVDGGPHEGDTTGQLQREFLQACWICDPDQVLFGPQGLHLGPCRGGRVWNLLGFKITDFDQHLPKGVPSMKVRKVSVGLQAPASPNGSSMRSTSSTQSESRLLYHSPHGSTSSRPSRHVSGMSSNSAHSTWSGHMSVDSWKLENAMGIDEEFSNMSLDSSSKSHRYKPLPTRFRPRVKKLPLPFQERFHRQLEETREFSYEPPSQAPFL